MSNNGSLKLSPRGGFQIINRLCNLVITSYYDPDTAPVGEFECRPLVFVLQKLSDFINEKVGIELISFALGENILNRKLNE